MQFLIEMKYNILTNHSRMTQKVFGSFFGLNFKILLNWVGYAHTHTHTQQSAAENISFWE